MHVAVDNFLSSPKYDEVVANLKAISQFEPTAKAEAKAETQASDPVANVDFAKVTEVDFISHDQHKGTATMATTLLITVKNVKINDLDDDSSHLVVVTAQAAKNLRLRYTNVQIVVVDDLLTSDKYDEIVKKLN